MLASCFQAQWQSAVPQVYLQREDFWRGLLLQEKKIWVSSGKISGGQIGNFLRSLLRQHCSKVYSDVVWRCPCWKHKWSFKWAAEISRGFRPLLSLRAGCSFWIVVCAWAMNQTNDELGVMWHYPRLKSLGRHWAHHQVPHYHISWMTSLLTPWYVKGRTK